MPHEQWPQVCDKLGPNLDMDSFWEALRPLIWKETLAAEIRNNVALQQWMQDWWHDVQNKNLLAKTGILPQYAEETLDALLNVLEARMSYLRPTNSSAMNTRSNGAAPLPLQVMVFGGSPTAGHECPKNPIGVQWGRGGPVLKPSFQCAWPSRFGALFNAIFLANDETRPHAAAHQPLLTTLNMAIAGTSSEVGATILQYQQWPRDQVFGAGPDLILWNYAINDAEEQGGADRQTSILNEFQNGATSLRPCDDHLPAIVYVDDWNGQPYTKAGKPVKWHMALSQLLYQHAAWYRVPIISVAQAVRHEFWQLFGPDNQAQHPYISFGRYDVHPGMMHHVLVAWSVVYQLLNALKGRCQRWKHTHKAQLPDNSTYQGIRAITDLPVKDIPNALGHHRLTNKGAHLAWQQQTDVRQGVCRDSVAVEGGTATTQEPCDYAWMAAKATRVDSHDKIRHLVGQYMVYNEGWEPNGFASKSPKLGWDAVQEKAAFSVRIPIRRAMVNSFTMAVMHSYGPRWDGTQLDLAIQNLNRTGTAEQTFQAVGYHATQTSTTFLYKYKLEQANHGEILDFRFNLTKGDNFKIMGMALCAQWT